MELKGKAPGTTICGGCEEGKGHRQPFPSSSSRANKPFQLIHVDLYGPVTPPTITGARWALIARDDYSGTLFVFLLSQKDHALGSIEAIRAEAARLRYVLEEHRSDNDSFLVSQEAEAYFKRHNIKTTTSVTYTPQQNG
jgi:hypothetical protein